MADNDIIYSTVFDIEKALQNLERLKNSLDDVEERSRNLFKKATPGVVSALKKTTTEALKLRAAFEKTYKTQEKAQNKAKRATIEEKAARDKLTAAMKGYSKAVREGDMATRKAARESERASKAAQRDMDRLNKKTIQTRKSLKRMFLSIGKGSQSSFGQLIRYATLGSIAIMGVYKAIRKVGEAKDDYLRFDELITTALTFAKPGEQRYRYGGEGAKEFRNSIREAANDVKTSAGTMADSALFWVKAGQKNLDSVKELSKVGVLFSRANRDAANNILDFARGNDILSDMVTMFRKDMSTPLKAMESATKLGEQLTAAANSSNIVVEQLFDYSKKVGALFKAGEVRDEEILAIAASLASAGLKEESGVHVRRILTQLAMPKIQKLLRSYGVETTVGGDLRSFADIFGELQNVLIRQAPMERMAFLKEVFGQRAISTAAALAGLNVGGAKAKGETSIAAIVKQIQDSSGIMSSNQEEQLKTLSGRIGALTDRITNALGEMFEKSGVLGDVVSGLEKSLPDILTWIKEFGITLRDTIIPGLKMTWRNIKEMLAPAMSILSGLFKSNHVGAERLADILTKLVKIWLSWKVAILAIKGLRIIDWFVQLIVKIKAATVATMGIGTATKGATVSAITAINKLPFAFRAIGPGIAAAIMGWEIGKLIAEYVVNPINNIESQTESFSKKYGKGYEKLEPGMESTETLHGKLKETKKLIQNIGSSPTFKEAKDKEVYTARKKIIEETIRYQQLSNAGKRAEIRSNEKMLSVARESREIIESASWRRKSEYKKAKEKSVTGDVESIKKLNEETSKYRDVISGSIRELNESREKLYKRYDEINKSLERASEKDRGKIRETLDRFKNEIDSISNNINEYTDTLKEIDNKTENRERKRINESKNIPKIDTGRGIGKGKIKEDSELNPFVAPLFSGTETSGRRIFTYGMMRGASEYLQRSSAARESLKRGISRRSGGANVYFGDTSISINAPAGTDPEALAVMFRKEMRKHVAEQQRDTRRAIENIIPGEM
jgi:TP901 family phage tail tape measure protein